MQLSALLLTYIALTCEDKISTIFKRTLNRSVWIQNGMRFAWTCSDNNLRNFHFLHHLWLCHCLYLFTFLHLPEDMNTDANNYTRTPAIARKQCNRGTSVMAGRFKRDRCEKLFSKKHLHHVTRAFTMWRNNSLRQGINRNKTCQKFSARKKTRSL